MKIKYLPLFLLVACGAKREPQGRIIHEDLRPFVEAFEAEYKATINYPVLVTKMDPKLDGACAVARGIEYEQRVVAINEDVIGWVKLYPYYFKTLIYHELAHCSFSVKHDNAMFDSGPMDGCPVSLMFPSNIGNCMLWFGDYYVAELGNKFRTAGHSFKPEIELDLTQLQTAIEGAK